jgi:hypothetical protein
VKRPEAYDAMMQDAMTNDATTNDGEMVDVICLLMFVKE